MPLITTKEKCAFLVLWVVSEKKNECICMYIYMSVAKTLLVIHVVACLHVHFFLLDFCVGQSGTSLNSVHLVLTCLFFWFCTESDKIIVDRS